MTLLSWINSWVEELLEAFFECLLPEEFFIFVLVDKFRSSGLNVIEIIEDNLHSTEQLELIFDLN
jgi:hypothetical protein